MRDEIIGYVPRVALSELTDLPVTGIVQDLDASLYAQLTEQLCWAARGPLEIDPSKKQLIPYIAVTRDERVWVMRRTKKQSEARLHEKLSIGVGGHLEKLDTDTDDVVMAGALRELTEELDISTSSPLRYIGLLNDDSNEVGQVHLGVIFRLELGANTEVSVREVDKMEGEWMTHEQLAEHHDRLETWSQLLFDRLRGA